MNPELQKVTFLLPDSAQGTPESRQWCETPGPALTRTWVLQKQNEMAG